MPNPKKLNLLLIAVASCIARGSARLVPAIACVTLSATCVTAPAYAQEKPTKKVGNFFKMISGQPRDHKKVGLSFSSIHGVEVYYPVDWLAQPAEEIPTDWELRLTRPNDGELTDIHMLEKPAYSLDQMRVDETDALTKQEHLKTSDEGKRRQIGEYKNIPGLETTYVFGKGGQNMRHVVYFGYPPMIHSLVLDCRPDEFEAIKPDFEHILSTISIHDGVH